MGPRRTPLPTSSGCRRLPPLFGAELIRSCGQDASFSGSTQDILLLHTTSKACTVPGVPQKPLPYKAAGARLRERRESLQKAGKIGKLKVLAKEVGVTVSSYLSYERGEYWPKGEKRKRLAVVMGWSDIELDGMYPLTASRV